MSTAEMITNLRWWASHLEGESARRYLSAAEVDLIALLKQAAAALDGDQ